ncbi:tol-pal system-associated acyl-CoA thioesterase [Consotaella salsifontis]|uniref:Acyl-CoA thioester hydrolase n=1 Tax=Consotaella salsifontis TaxID=1365950 RepID=A0A1T4RFM5_9HYPH|nr:tol-pal system-associated acyl-CoA thioesterase [Consotaella salsifontis]SKA14471.1 acyl-CoA thioester hydrolase [Consotaella salsifontis]
MSEGLSGRLENGAHIFPVRVYYEDTDFSGVVYHARYLHFLERARTELLRLLGISHSRMEEGGYGAPLAFAVRRMEIDFHRSARIDDLLSVRTSVRKIAGARIVLTQQALRGAEVLIEAVVTIAVVANGRAHRLPPEIAARFGEVLAEDGVLAR